MVYKTLRGVSMAHDYGFCHRESLEERDRKTLKIAACSTQHTKGIMTAVVIFLTAAGCAMLTGTPDLDTPDGQVYARRCGACHGMQQMRGHGVPDPRSRTMVEWQEVLPKMEGLIREKGLMPLTAPERDAIFRYLSSHAKL
jgi:hypothetical protein